MKPLLTIIKSDYLQRTRTYSFLITLCASLAIAYTFVPEPNANYSTIRISNYIGIYNASWFGYVTAIMTSLFLSLIGFYLVNSGIKNDITTKVGQIAAATPISNFKYLLFKAISNYLILLTIVFAVFLMSILLFFIYNDGYPFLFFQFVKPYFIITIPTLFFIAVLAVVFEVIFTKYSVLQNIGFFFLCTFMMAFSSNTENQFSLDVFGSKIVTHQMQEEVNKITKTDENTSLNIGYVIGNVKKINRFEFTGINFPTSFIISRFVWVLFSVGLVGLSSLFFHRFNVKERKIKKRKKLKVDFKTPLKEIAISNLSKPQVNYGILPLLKTEIKLLVRKGKKWFWLINFSGMILLAILPLDISLQFVLPILWFLQVTRFSDVTTKEVENKMHYFAFTSFKPLKRLLFSQVISAVVLLLFLAIPLLVRLLIDFDLHRLSSVILGGIFIVFLSAFLGVFTKGKKLFEVLFFMITYANINEIPFSYYFGSLTSSLNYTINLSIITLILASLCFYKRRYDLRN